MKQTSPLVSCIMPTYNRRRFVPDAIRYFLRQDYENKELIIIDDGTDAISDLVPDLPDIRYYRLENKITLGAKLNMACRHANGSFIANWDDDDWYSSHRLTYQLNELLDDNKELCGLNHLLYYDIDRALAFEYIYPQNERLWLLGSSLFYTKALWSQHPFADINVGMDGLFVWATPADKIKVLTHTSLAIYIIHGENVSPKQTESEWWHPYSVDEIKSIAGDDWACYAKEETCLLLGINSDDEDINKEKKTIRNVYACLVHEAENCIVDLVRNLRYHDPNSPIILYNGGHEPDLFTKDFPYEKWNVFIYPNPHPVKHGYLHRFALDCMQFALAHFSFDTFTCVDSDQLCIRTGYTLYLAHFLEGKSKIGMLSKRPQRITNADTHDTGLWPALQALQEFILWQPFLKLFPDGESKFVHWTFWPSSVFLHDAVRDLVQLFRENNMLQDIMSRTKIWATEEVILPTLVTLLGYDIVANPCSYDYVQYKKTYSLAKVDSALHKNDSYWIHPIERCYDNPLRKQIRDHYNHYVIQEEKKTKENSQPVLLLTTALIEQVRKIEGWLSDAEADLLIAVAIKAVTQIQSASAIVETGSYHGKSTVIFGSIIKAFAPNYKIYAIDPHDGNIGVADGKIQPHSSSLTMLQNNICRAGLNDFAELIQDCSSHVVWQQPVALLFIDGLHDYVNVAKDFWHFSDWIVPRGYIVFHDYADYYPGVKAFADELLQAGSYHFIKKTDSLLVVQKQQ